MARDSLNRYSLNYAMYLSHHWAARREMGESQITVNYYRAFVDYIARFTFGKGVRFGSPKETEAIVPDRLERVWEIDNDKMRVLYEIAQNGGVTGDSFIKVAYEEPWTDDIGLQHPGRVRILPLNSSFCFPEWHPHDRTRLLRFKQKYRFWGCVDTATEALTRHGWTTYDKLLEGEDILTLDPESNEIRWQPATKVNVYEYDGHMVSWDGIKAVSTPNHRWLVEQQHGRLDTVSYERKIARTEFALDGDPAVTDLRNGSRIVIGGGVPKAFATEATWADEQVATAAWYVTEGSDHTNQTGCESIYLSQKTPSGLVKLRALKEWWNSQGGTFNEYAPKKDGVIEFYLGKGVKETLKKMTPYKEITTDFIESLTYEQAVIFYDSLIDGDGSRKHGEKNTVRWYQVVESRLDAFQMLAAMLGKRTSKDSDGTTIQVYHSDYLLVDSVKNKARRVYLEDGKIWCPTVESGIWFARRKGQTFWTGNTSLEGTRQVFTYVEVLTDDSIEEYLNDELIDSRPNPLGKIPVVHIANVAVSGSPWGLSDANDIISLNRTYNEISTDIADIVNYHAAPVTVIVGAKASNLEKGAKKVWGGLPKDSQVFNLEGGSAGLAGAMEYLKMIKSSMHELMNVPESALGQVQPISNTSGVALSIQYQPLMNRWAQKTAVYGKGLEQVNELVMLTLALKEPEVLKYNPDVDGPIKEGQLSELDPNDPITYRTYAVFPAPLPLDKLVLLNELQTKMAMGLESKEGALRALGEEFPEEKLVEIRDELLADAKADGSLALYQTWITKQTMDLTGMMPGPDGSATPMEPTITGTGDEQQLTPPSATLPDALSSRQVLIDEDQIRNDLLTQAFGTKLPMRNAIKDDNSL